MPHTYNAITERYNKELGILDFKDHYNILNEIDGLYNTECTVVGILPKSFLSGVTYAKTPDCINDRLVFMEYNTLLDFSIDYLPNDPPQRFIDYL